VCFAGAQVKADRQMARIGKSTAMPVPTGLEEADPTLGPMDFVPRFGTKSDRIRLFRPVRIECSRICHRLTGNMQLGVQYVIHEAWRGR